MVRVALGRMVLVVGDRGEGGVRRVAGALLGAGLAERDAAEGARVTGRLAAARAAAWTALLLLIRHLLLCL